MRTINVKYTGKCACCGGVIKRGELADYDPAKRQLWHYKAAQGDSPKCTAQIRRDRDFVDLDRMYEDQCADICGR